VPSPNLSPIPTSTHVTAPLTPLSQALFQNLQLHGSILGHHDTDVPHGHSLAAAAAPGASATVTAATPPAPQRPPATPKTAFSSMMSPRKTWRYAYSRNT
jgi:hypothetical protein